MSDASRDPFADFKLLGPNNFSFYARFYAREVADLLSRDDDFLLFTSQTSELSGECGEVRDDKPNHNSEVADSLTGSGSLFNDAIGDELSVSKREKLKALLRRSVTVLKPEVDEVQGPVMAMCRLQSRLEIKKQQSSYSVPAVDFDAGHFARKKLKTSSPCSSFSSSSGFPAHTSSISCGSSKEGSGSRYMDSKFSDEAFADEKRSNAMEKNCACCHSAVVPSGATELEKPVHLCNACRIKDVEDTLSSSNIGANNDNEKENEEVDHGLQFLTSNSLLVERTLKKYSDEMFATLGHMEQHLEELLNTIMSKCRSMTLAEKQELQKLIKKLPPKNLERVVEIMGHSRPTETQSCDEICLKLGKEDDATLWRLYYYLGAVERARHLSK